MDMDMFVVVDDDNQEGEVVDHYLPHKLQVEDVVEIVVVVVYDMDHADDYCIDGLGNHIAESNLNQSCVCTIRISLLLLVLVLPLLWIYLL